MFSICKAKQWGGGEKGSPQMNAVPLFKMMGVDPVGLSGSLYSVTSITRSVVRKRNWITQILLLTPGA